MSKPPYIVRTEKLIPKGYEGIAIYPFIFVRHKASDTVVRHEKIHIEQQLRGWLIGFYIMYFYYHLRYGYDLNPYELEAYARQDEI